MVSASDLRKITIFMIFTAMVALSSCAPALSIEECLKTENYGFLGGLWHGLIAPFSFFVSLFMDDVAMYAVNNNGGWYDFGFVIGAGILFGSGGKASKRKS